MTDTCRIQVVCRVRPLNAKEESNGSSFVMSFPSTNSVASGNKTFQYDHVLSPACTQAYVYQNAAKPLVKDVLSGYNATIFAYGQTASGKTHTMEGVLGDAELQGIIPRIVEEVFEHIYSMEDSLEVQIKISYFEIYMDKIRDLLDVTKFNLPIGENKNKVPYVKGATEQFVTSPEEVFALIEEAKSNRHVSVTNMNAHSSRSHAVFLICIKQENKETRKTLTGKLYLVDLAGSEKVGKTNAQGLTLEEAKMINKSLLSLSNVISALAEGNKGFIPYRDSKLTRVLQESLGGNARTTLIICCSPSSYNEAESKSTLQFGNRAKTIKNKVAVNVELTAEEWRRRFEREREARLQLQGLLGQCQAELRRWRAGEAVSEAEQVSGSSPSAAALPAPLVPGAEALSDVQAFAEERAKLCRQMDEKDEELHMQAGLVEQLTMKVSELEEKLDNSQQENMDLNKQIAIIEQELVNSQDEVHEVMQALEELAVSYDTKDRDIGSVQEEKQALLDELDQLQGSVDAQARELNQLRENSQCEKRRSKELVSSLFRELNEVGSVLGGRLEDRLFLLGGSLDLLEEDFTRAKIHLSNMRCEARTLMEQRKILEQSEREAKEFAQDTARELSSCKQRLSQFEAQNSSLVASLRGSEAHKAELEGTLEALNTQLEALRSIEEGPSKGEGEGEGEGGQRWRAAAVRDELQSKETLISHLNKQYQLQLSEVDGLRAELQRLREQQLLEKDNYNRIRKQAQAREKAQVDFGGLTDTVSRELERLGHLRETYLQRISQKLRNRRESAGLGASEERDALSPDKRELIFLEKNLEELTRAHKKTVSENAELRREIPRLQSMLSSKGKRVGELEQLLRETRREAGREHQQMRADMESMRSSFMAKLKEREREYYPGRTVRRHGGPVLVRAVPRPKGADSGFSRDALLAGAGVSVIGQRKRSQVLNCEPDSSVEGGVPLSSLNRSS